MEDKSVTCKKIIILTIIAIITIALYWQIKKFEFVNYDDNIYIKNKTATQAITNIEVGNWQPLTFLSHITAIKLFGFDAGKHHLINLLIHLLNIALLFFILLKLTNSVWKSSLVALLFAIHPLNVESVVWVAERKGLLSSFFALLAIFAYIQNINILWIILFFVLGLMCKSSIMVVPILLLTLDYPNTPEHKANCKQLPNKSGNDTKKIISTIPLFALATVFAITNLILQLSNKQNLGTITQPFLARLLNMFLSYGVYLKKIFIPSNLAVFYPFPKTFFAWQIIISILCLTIISIFAIKYRKQKPYFFLGWLWFVIMLLPVSGLVQIGTGGAGMADRYMYLPMIGIFLMIVGSFRGKTLGIIALTIPIFATITYKQIQTWQNSTTLFSHTIKVTENNYLAHNNLGMAIFRENPRQAVEHFKLAVKFNPEYAQAYNNLGVIAFEQKNFDLAIEFYKKAIDIHPHYTKVYNNLGAAFFLKKDYEQAIKYYEQALKLDPKNLEARHDLKVVLGRV